MWDPAAPSSSSHRAGRYVRQPAGYRAFIPAPLPPDPPLDMSGMLAQLSRADRALARLDGSVHSLPDPDLFVFMYVRKEAVLSSRIEGTQSSINDVLEAEARILARGHTDVGEVLNYVAAMNEGLRRLETLPLSIRLIKEIHARLMQGVRGAERQPGEIRTSQNWIGPRGSGLGDAIFVPPPADLVLESLSDFERFLHAETPEIPALIKVGLAHAQFETIHPFLDGNGRVGRLLITFLLCQADILRKPVLYLSHWFRQHQQTYYTLLQAVRDRGDWEGWLGFFLDGVATVANEATEVSRRIVDLREAHRNQILREFGRTAAGGLTVLEHLFRNPIVQVKDILQLLGITHTSASSLIFGFERAGILVEITGQKRNRRFAYEPYIQLFRD